MACFVAPAAVAVLTTVVQRIVKNKENAAVEGQTKGTAGKWTAGKWTQRLRWLNTMLWGGSALLALEHVWNGEVVLRPPFLTALETSGGTASMFHEILTYGLTMTAVVLVAWGVMVGVAELRTRKSREPEAAPEVVNGER